MDLGDAVSRTSDCQSMPNIEPCESVFTLQVCSTNSLSFMNGKLAVDTIGYLHALTAAK